MDFNEKISQENSPVMKSNIMISNKSIHGSTIWNLEKLMESLYVIIKFLL